MFFKIIEFFSARMEKPTLYGWFHLMCLGIVLIFSILVIIFRKKFSQKFINNTLLITGIVFLVFEIYKQLVMTYDSNGLTGILWYIFPFQFCSTPIYLTLLAGILRKGKVYDCIVSYLGTYSLFAGLAVMFLPTTVFISLIGINIQTMVVHGGMVVIGFLLLSTQTVKYSWKSLLKATLIFVIMSFIAMLMNVLWYFFGTTDTFNMFFISPWYECTLPILDTIQANAPYIIFLLCYFVGFFACSGIVFGIYILIDKLVGKIKSKKKGV